MKRFAFIRKFIGVFLLFMPLFAQAQDISKALKVGDKAPDFTLSNINGKNVSLSALLAKGPVVLTWYRGGWCPYCNEALAKLQKILPQIKEQGANLLALTPEQSKYALSTSEKNKLEFEILSDTNNKIAELYGLKYTLDAKTASFYENKMQLSTINGNNLSQLPIPATYIIDQKGIIRFAYVNPNYRERVNPKQLIAELKKLKL